MSLERVTAGDRDEWLAKRLVGIGASEASAIMGVNPFMSARELWNAKTGAKGMKPADNAATSLGKRAEPALRELFRAYNPEFEVSYHEFDMLYQEGRPWLFATLDGELTDKDGRKGVLEIKTGAPGGRAGWSKWDGGIPEYYYIQVLHQLLATGYGYCILYASLQNREGDLSVRTYRIEAADAAGQMEYLLGKEEAFWNSVLRREVPATAINL